MAVPFTVQFTFRLLMVLVPWLLIVTQTSLLPAQKPRDGLSMEETEASLSVMVISSAPIAGAVEFLGSPSMSVFTDVSGVPACTIALDAPLRDRSPAAGLVYPGL